MVAFSLEEEKGTPKSRLGIFKGMLLNGAKRTTSFILEKRSSFSSQDHDRINRAARVPPENQTMEQNRNGSAAKSRLSNDGPTDRGRQQSDMELMKERFAKMLLGEDMSGGGKGVSSALALSNAITNLAASAFGEQKKLEPMPAEKKAKWRKEIDWLLSVADYIVELIPSTQKSKDGTCMEIMVTKQRNDLLMNIPASRKLDNMLLVRNYFPSDCLDNFKNQNEFYYGSKDDDESEQGKEMRKDDKWWIPVPKVPQNGLSEVTRRWLQYQKDSVNQVLKAAMAINAQVLAEMEIPESYIEALPKNGRASLGDSIYKIITDEFFDPDFLLSSTDLSSEYKIVDLKNKIEASVVIWKRKMNAKDSKSSWGSAVSLEKREILEERAETILLILKHRFPGISQSDLDISKIQYNRDVGHAILESYSRIIESLAFNVLSKIQDVMQADSIARNPSNGIQRRMTLKEPPVDKLQNPKEEKENATPTETPTSKTLLDFMGWSLETGDAEDKKDLQDEVGTKHLSKPANFITNKRISYLERLEKMGGSRSPTARH